MDYRNTVFIKLYTKMKIQQIKNIKIYFESNSIIVY